MILKLETNYSKTNIEYRSLHQQTWQKLEESLDNGQIKSSWILYGQPGIGKFFLVMDFISSLFLDANPKLAKNKNVTSEKFNHPDLLIIDKLEDKKEISIDEIRKMKHFLYLSPAESDHKVVIINNSELMSNNAANALLKVLEEPPVNTIILLICGNLSKLPRTVLSRCKKLYIPSPKWQDSLSILQQTSNIPNPDLIHYLTISDNSIAKAECLYQNQALKVFHQFINLISQTSPPAILDILKLVQKDNADSWKCFAYLITYFVQNLTKFACTGYKDHFVSDEEKDLFMAISQKTSIDQIISLCDKVTVLIARVESANLDIGSNVIIIFNLIRKLRHP